MFYSTPLITHSAGNCSQMAVALKSIATLKYIVCFDSYFNDVCSKMFHPYVILSVSQFTLKLKSKASLLIFSHLFPAGLVYEIHIKKYTGMLKYYLYDISAKWRLVLSAFAFDIYRNYISKNKIMA